jgi:hypothetical protein
MVEIKKIYLETWEKVLKNRQAEIDTISLQKKGKILPYTLILLVLAVILIIVAVTRGVSFK